MMFMKIKIVSTKKDIAEFKRFRKNLYKNDKFYVSTIEFTCDMLLKKETEFARSITIIPFYYL